MERIEDLTGRLAYELSRRSMLEHIGGVVAAGTVLGLGLEATQVPPVRPQPNPFGQPEKVFPGLVAITKDSIPRTYPAIPFGRVRGLRRFSPTNKIPWGQVEAINGVDVRYFYTTLVRNPVVVDGQDVRRDARPTSHSDWLRLQFGLKDGKEQTGFINFTWENIQYVRPIAPMYPGSMKGVLQHDGTFAIKTPDIDERLKIGEVTPAVGFIEDIWSSYTRAKIAGQIPLDIGEDLYPYVPIAPNFRDCRLAEEVRAASPVEALYGVPFPIAPSRAAMEPLGFAPWDTIVDRLLTTNGLNNGFTLRQYIDSEIFDKEGKPIKIPDHQVIHLETNSFAVDPKCSTGGR